LWCCGSMITIFGRRSTSNQKRRGRARAPCIPRTADTRRRQHRDKWLQLPLPRRLGEARAHTHARGRRVPHLCAAGHGDVRVDVHARVASREAVRDLSRKARRARGISARGRGARACGGGRGSCTRTNIARSKALLAHLRVAGVDLVEPAVVGYRRGRGCGHRPVGLLGRRIAVLKQHAVHGRGHRPHHTAAAAARGRGGVRGVVDVDADVGRAAPDDHLARRAMSPRLCVGGRSGRKGFFGRNHRVWAHLPHLVEVGHVTGPHTLVAFRARPPHLPRPKRTRARSASGREHALSQSLPPPPPPPPYCCPYPCPYCTPPLLPRTPLLRSPQGRAPIDRRDTLALTATAARPCPASVGFRLRPRALVLAADQKRCRARLSGRRASPRRVK